LTGAIAPPFAIGQFSHDGWTVAAQAQAAVSLEIDDLDIIHSGRSSLRVALRTCLQTERRKMRRSGTFPDACGGPVDYSACYKPIESYAMVVGDLQTIALVGIEGSPQSPEGYS